MKSLPIYLTLVIFTVGAFAAETTPITLTAECTTKGTDWDGSRNSCHSREQCQAVPEGFVIAEKSVERSCSSCNGSESSVEQSCRFRFDNYVEILPGSGIKQPTRICVSAHARSPRHHRGSRGWAKCTFSGHYVKF